MKVSELIEKLKGLPQDYVCILSSDAEGNEFSPVSELSIGEYVPETTWHGEYNEGEDIQEKENAVSIWPVN